MSVTIGEQEEGEGERETVVDDDALNGKEN